MHNHKAGLPLAFVRLLHTAVAESSGKQARLQFRAQQSGSAGHKAGATFFPSCCSQGMWFQYQNYNQIGLCYCALQFVLPPVQSVDYQLPQDCPLRPEAERCATA